jgi:cellulose synthase/poly-beta-1,6-N-acetylglucosamine synthase-like glycosyltransferase
MKFSQIKFSLIICGYNEEENLNLAIESCLNQDYPKNKYEIIYIDNNSKDNSINIAKSYGITVASEKKQGLSEARNKGIKLSKGEILVFLDADIKLDKNYLASHERTFDDPKVGAGGGMVLPMKSTWVSNYLGVSLLERYPRYKNFINVSTYPGCNLSIRNEVLNEVGNFKEGFKVGDVLIPRAEDKEICQRIRSKGFIIKYNPNAKIYHKNRFLLKELIKTWIKGSRSRLYLIKIGKKDPLSLFFKWNVPLITVFLLTLSLFINLKIGIGLALSFIFIFFILGFKTYLSTGLLIQSLFIKPFMDITSILVVNASVIFYRLK